jgi:dipeptidyl aminopeptidase/acylaminoacyl peptidase
MYNKRFLFFLLTISVLPVCVFAQKSQLVAYPPSRTEMLQRCKKAQLMDSTAKNTVFKTNVQANWLPGGNKFWYRNILKDSVREYIMADVIKGEKSKAFDHERLAAELSKQSGEIIDAKRIKMDKIWFSSDAKQMAFEMKGKNWQCNLINYHCTKIDSLPKDTTQYPSLYKRGDRWRSFATDSISPDEKWAAYIKEGNVFIEPAGGGKAIQFTHDGTNDKPYGQLAWAPDSKCVVGYHIDPVKDSPVYYVLSSVPNTTRGQLRSLEYKQPGDPFSTFQMYLFNIAAQTTAKVNTEVLDFFEAPALHWKKDATHFLYEKVDRGHQRFRIIEVDAITANAKAIFDETTNTFIYESRIFTYYLPETNEILMSSEKDGWQHIYLLDASTGKEKNKLTKGNWVVRSVDSIDVKKRELWFTASGMNENEDPCYIHYYRIGFDGEKLVSLTQPGYNHTVNFSSNKTYYLDTYSRVDISPVTELHRTSDGKKIMDVERADISEWKKNDIRLPEVFTAKGRDGVTDIWGIVCRPSDFDSTLKYPLIENIYAGPQDAFVPKKFMPYSEMQSMAQLGFIVVQIDGMGTANRSKAFHDVCWKNLADAGFPDRILWMKALAAKYSYADTTRVGIYGTSAGGQNSTGALLFHPEFYKAAVSACGCQDNRIDKQWWNEQWMGYPVGPHYAQQSNITNAAKLQGNLLLIVGEADENVPPESTYRLADALIKANKTFDFLAIPGMGHSDGGPYGRIWKRDFFVKHLLGIDPPNRNEGELK